MKTKRLISLSVLFLFFACSMQGKGWIRINQLGYLPQTPKVAVMIADEQVSPGQFQVKRVATDELRSRGYRFEKM